MNNSKKYENRNSDEIINIDTFNDEIKSHINYIKLTRREKDLLHQKNRKINRNKGPREYIKCEICGKLYTKSNSWSHKRTRAHNMNVEFNNQIKNKIEKIIKNDF